MDKPMEKPTIYTVATAHLDTSWHWPLERTIEEYIPRTLEENFALFEKYPEYTFSFEGAYRYALMEEYYPRLFEKLKGYVAQGRWRVAGSAWENGDTNIPSPEALLRNILLGNRYFEEKFGKRSCDIFLPDCFGFGWALPGLAAHAHLKGFITQKLQWGVANRVPFALGRWQGPDGGEIFACPDGHDYAADLRKARGNYYMRRALAMARKRGVYPAALILHGVGDQGGAPREKSVQVACGELARNDAKPGTPRVLCAGSDQIFRDLYALPAAERGAFPAYRGEWLLTTHGAGCYTSRTWSKRWNRQAEQLALAAEHACAFAGFLGRMEYPREALNTVWKRVIAHQFHDDMTGTSNEISYQRNWDDLMVSQQQFARAYTQGVSAVANAMGVSFAVGRCAAVSNVTQWERREAVELRLPQRLQGSAVRVLDADGNELPAQLNPDGQTVVFAAALAPLSVALFDVQVDARSCGLDTGLYVSEQSLENQYISVRVDANGDIASLYDKRLRRETLRTPVRLALFDFDGSPAWPAWELYYPELRRKPAEYPRKPKIEILERGPARAALKIVRQARGSTFTQVLSLDAAGEWLRVENEVDWHSRRTLLKVEVNTAASNAMADYDIGFGVIRRGVNTARRYEVPAQQWAGIADRGGAFGMAVLSDSKTGWDHPGRHTLRLTGVYTPRVGSRYDALTLDFGRSRFAFGLYPHAGGRRQEAGGRYLGIMRAGACFGQKPAAFWVNHSGGEGPAALCFGSADGMLLRALKQSEDCADEWVARVQEADGVPLAEGTLSLGGGIEAFREIYASEEERLPVNCAYIKEGALKLSLRPFEIRSFALKINPMEAAPPAQILPIDLPAQPCPLLPDSCPLTACEGQSVPLPAGRELRLWAASLAGDQNAAFAVGGARHIRRIYDMREAVGAGDLFRLGASGYVKPAMPVREFTHMLDGDGKVLVGVRARFFEIALPLPGEETTLTLPDDADIAILRAEVCGEAGAVPASPLFDEMERRPAAEVAVKLTPREEMDSKAKMPLRAVRCKLGVARAFLRLRMGIDFGR